MRLPKPATRQFPHKSRSLRESWSRLRTRLKEAKLAYNWRVTASLAPNAVIQTAQTTAASNTFVGLTPGVAYNIEVNAVGSAGPSN